MEILENLKKIWEGQIWYLYSCGSHQGHGPRADLVPEISKVLSEMLAASEVQKIIHSTEIISKNEGVRLMP